VVVVIGKDRCRLHDVMCLSHETVGDPHISGRNGWVDSSPRSEKHVPTLIT